MNKTFKRRHSKLLHELFKAYTNGIITQDEKIKIKSLLLTNKNLYQDLNLLSMSNEKKKYLKGLFNVCLDDSCVSTDKDTRLSEISFGPTLEPIEVELNLTNNIEETEIYNFFSSDAEV
jgi:hypothetical protein